MAAAKGAAEALVEAALSKEVLKSSGRHPIRMGLRQKRDRVGAGSQVISGRFPAGRSL